jgi:acyl-CoA synthetase (AMP-forming)/AMP-acid ligase II/uncharacterized OB-fold protein
MMDEHEFPSFWDATAAGRLALLTCGTCGHRGVLPRPVCPSCWSEELSWRPTGRRGVVDSVTRVHRPPNREVAPGYQLALVRLDEGPRILVRVDGGAVGIGDVVRIELAAADSDGRRLPVATPVDTFAGALERLAEAMGDRIAIVDAGREGHPATSFATLHAEVRAAAVVLAEAGLGRGDVLLNWLPNVKEWVVVTFAAASLGVLTIPINTRFRERELASTLQATGAAAIVAPTGFLSIPFTEIIASVLGSGARGSAASNATRPTVFTVDCSPGTDAPPPSLADAVPLTEAIRRVADRPAATGGRVDDPVVAFSTSGTTGRPKLAVHSQGAVTTHARHVARAFVLRPGARLLGALPLHGVFGFSGAIAALLAGATTVLQPVFDGGHAASLIEETGVTHCYGPDTMLRAILDGASRPGQLESWRAGAFADFSGDGPTVARQVQDSLGIPLRGVYGSSECLALMSLWPEDAPEELRSMGGGRPVSPDIEVRAVDPETGEPLGIGTHGELQVRGYNVTTGYHRDPEVTAASRTQDGWFRTGDLGYVRDDGSFVYLSRLGDTLRLGGYLVDPREIEEHLVSHPAVRRAAVVGVHRAGVGDVAVGFVETASPVEAEQVREFCRSRIAAFKVPQTIVVLDTLPTIEGPNGTKIQRRQLRELADGLVPTSAEGQGKAGP